MNRTFTRGVLLSFLLLGTLLAQGQDVAAGEKLFNANCKSCHAVDKKVIGPALQGWKDRVPGDGWIYKWVRNSTEVIKSGDAYANQIYKEYNGTLMTAFPQLSDGDIDNIMAWVDNYTPPTPPPGPATAATQPQGSIPTGPLYTGLVVLIGVLALMSFALIFLIVVVIHAVRAKESGTSFSMPQVAGSFRKAATSKFTLTTVTLLLVAGGLNYTVKTARGVGLHQGYTPAQPVAFSHKIHAGQYGISCNYCHTGVEKSKSATIPGANICMNCHNYIEEGPNYGKVEIGKVRAAYEANRRIEWVRIHNLPDLVYFNHAQHVKVGGVECQECHGPVETMEVVYQFSDLSMGWCITCHREKQVDVTKNDYYLKVHNEYVGKETAVTVSDLGGLECAKCHY
ncbi:MAG: c-type cytochrome [Bacteroidia bacterium]|nr:c-type cytochrome [Bacteroidia bacterium]